MADIVGLLGIVSLVIGLGSLVCWIMEIVAAFQKDDGPLMGILSIVLCPLGGFIIGWIKAKEWGISKLMMIWTGFFIGSIVIQILAGVLGAAAAAVQ